MLFINQIYHQQPIKQKHSCRYSTQTEANPLYHLAYDLPLTMTENSRFIFYHPRVIVWSPYYYIMVPMYKGDILDVTLANFFGELTNKLIT